MEICQAGNCRVRLDPTDRRGAVQAGVGILARAARAESEEECKRSAEEEQPARACHATRQLVNREELFSARPKIPAQDRMSVVEAVMGRMRFQISRTATETARPIQKASVAKKSLVNRERRREPRPKRMMATTTQVKKTSSVERMSI